MTAAAGLLASFVGAAGAIQQGAAAQAAANAQARVLDQQASSERQAAAAEASDFRRRQSAVQAAGIARAGAAGIDISSGSPLLVDDAFVREMHLGSARILHQGAVRSARLQGQRNLTLAEGKSARRAGNMAAFGNILSGYAKFQEDFAGSYGGGSSPTGTTRTPNSAYNSSRWGLY